MSVKSLETKPSRRPTLKDLARALKVAPSTISNAYNRPDQLSEGLREQIFHTARIMGYSGPHPVARGLRRGRTGNIGIVYGEHLSYAVADPAAILFLQGVTLASEAEQLGLTLVPAPFEGRDYSGIRRAAVDGIIYYCRTDQLLIDTVRELSLPAVLVDHSTALGLPSVNVTDEAGARAAAQHLLERGHRRIGIISLERQLPSQAGWVNPGAPDSEFVASRDRLSGYVSEFTRAGLGWNRDYFVYACGTNARVEGKLALNQLLSRHSITAVLAMSDVLAFGAIERASELGLSVPRDLAVVGFDDVPEATRANLSSVYQPHIEKGRLAGELLIRQLRGETIHSPERLQTRLMVRGSSDAPAPE